MNKLYTFLIALILLSALSVKAQIAQLNPKIITIRQYEAAANKAFEKRQFNKALEYYLIILKDEPQRSDLFWNTAEAANQTRHYTVAYKYYESLNQTDRGKTYPQLTFKRAMVKKSLGDYEGAIALLNTFKATAPIAGTTNANDLIKEAEAEIKACEWAKPLSESKPAYDVVRMDDINTNFTDVAPVQHGNTLYFTSAFKSKDDSTYVTNIYQTDLKGKVERLDINSTMKGEYTAHFALNSSGSRVYYNIGKETDGVFMSEIYYRDKGTDGLWKATVRLPDTINTRNYTATQPNVGVDKTTGREVLYFVSDRPGGKGGLDIWYADIDAQGNVGSPKNLSTINTAKDEITPFYFSQANILFFSTEGYQTMGGFDVFYANKNEGGDWSVPSHSGFPLNSSYDDMYYSINGETGRSYFVSNRKGGKCFSPDKDCVCNDMYNYDIKLDLKSETFLASTGEALKGCIVELLNVETGKSINLLVNKEGNNFDFPLELGQKYRLIGSKEGHRADTINFDTKGYWQSTTIYKKLELRPNLKLNVYVFEEITNVPINGARVDIYEMASGYSVTSGFGSKNGKLIFSEKIVGNSFTTNKIEFGKTYILYSFKEEFAPDSSILVIDAYGSSERYEYSDSLFLKPFRGLPLTLFFHDDHPNPNTRDSITFLTYDETYRSYIIRENEYLRYNYGAGKKVSFSEANEISNFFRDSIKGNYQKLMDFSVLMTKFLTLKKNLEIVIEGYASPLADSVYNRLLTSRRISSLINHFYEYENGVLRPYIANKQLTLRIIPFGETKAKPGVSDNFNDKLNSIYSLAAMKERKVEIKEINQLSDEEVKSLSSYDPKESLKGYWDFNSHISFLDKNVTVAGSAEGKVFKPKGDIKDPSATNKTDSKAGKATTMPTKVRHEFVLVDSYTGDIISKGANVQIYDFNNDDKKIGKARLKGSNYRYDLMSNKEYLIKGHVPGYSEGLVAYLGSYTEGSDVVRDTMYLTPFNGLPLALYFNNDRPDPNTKRIKTAVPYNKAYKDYYGQKNEFIKQYNQLLSKIGSVPMAANEMQQFFDGDVKRGYDKLVGFAAIMKSYLKQGRHIEVIIEGHASPLANTDYNEYLTSRRINAVINFLSVYDGGSLKKYIKNGELELKIKPLGESESTNLVSDDINDPKRSIYSIEASKARKVIIRDIQIRE